VSGSEPPPKDDRRCILNALEQGALQPDEDPSSDSLEVAARWGARYQELLAYNADLTGLADSAAHRLSAGPRRQSIDQLILQKQAAHYRRRLDFWLARAVELG
jgi:hypothetical protein